MPLSTEIKHGTITAYNNHKCRCAECKATKSMYARRSRERHPDYRKNYYAANTEKAKEATRQWRLRNREHTIAQARKWNVKNRERYNANAKAWRVNNRDKVTHQNRKLKAMRRNAERCVVTEKDWQRLVNRHNGCCAYCGIKEKMTMEHVVPISRGGRHSIGNLLPVCIKCNISKNKKLLIEWRRVCR